MMKVDLVTFGEAMVRLSPPPFRRLEQATTLDIQIGGSELNTAITAQRLGLQTAFVTRLPINPLGRMVANKAREHGVDTSHCIWSDGDRVGLYFMEFGAYGESCAFQPCTHDHEPECQVKKLVEDGVLCEDRYISYLHILSSLKEFQATRYR